MSCKDFSERRSQCHSLYGKQGEDCLNEELTEKRCLALYHCPKQAHAYYGDTSMEDQEQSIQGNGSESIMDNAKTFSQMTSFPPYMWNKGLCASWAESFAYANKTLEYGEEVAQHHLEAKEYVDKNKTLKRKCRDVAFDLAKCLRTKNLKR